MQGHKRVPTPEMLADYASRSLFVEDMAMDAGSGVAFLLCKKSKLELHHTVVALDSAQLASLAITYIQVAEAIRTAAAQAAVQMARTIPPDKKS